MTSTVTASLPATYPAPGRPGRWLALRHVRITFTGLLGLAIMLLVGLAALNSEANLLFLLAAVGIGILIVNLVAPARMVAGVDVERIIPAAVVAGRPFTITYIVRNRRRRGWAWALLITECPLSGRGPRFPRAFLPGMGPGQERRVELTGNCPRRGPLNLHGVRVTSCFPFGLFSCTIDLAARAELVVYPAVGRFRRDPFKDRRYANTTATSRPRREHGGQDEFYGVREYRQGDNYRWIHWRRSAHAGQLVVREMMPLRQTQVIVMLEPWPGARGGGWLRRRTDEASGLAAERLISAAATAVCDGIERGHRVGLICRAELPVVIAPAGGRAHQQRLLRQLATLTPGADDGLDELVARVRWSTSWHARCLVCATRVDESHHRLVRLLSRRAEATQLLSPESESFDALFELARRSAGPRRAR